MLSNPQCPDQYWNLCSEHCPSGLLKLQLEVPNGRLMGSPFGYLKPYKVVPIKLVCFSQCKVRPAERTATLAPSSLRLPCTCLSEYLLHYFSNLSSYIFSSYQHSLSLLRHLSIFFIYYAFQYSTLSKTAFPPSQPNCTTVFHAFCIQHPFLRGTDHSVLDTKLPPSCHSTTLCDSLCGS